MQSRVKRYEENIATIENSHPPLAIAEGRYKTPVPTNPFSNVKYVLIGPSFFSCGNSSFAGFFKGVYSPGYRLIIYA